jgi:hypothetical protein
MMTSFCSSSSFATKQYKEQNNDEQMFIVIFCNWTIGRRKRWWTFVCHCLLELSNKKKKLKLKLLEQGWAKILLAWTEVGNGVDMMEFLVNGDGIDTMESWAANPNTMASFLMLLELSQWRCRLGTIEDGRRFAREGRGSGNGLVGL